MAPHLKDRLLHELYFDSLNIYVLFINNAWLSIDQIKYSQTIDKKLILKRWGQVLQPLPLSKSPHWCQKQKNRGEPEASGWCLLPVHLPGSLPATWHSWLSGAINERVDAHFYDVSVFSGYSDRGYRFCHSISMWSGNWCGWAIRKWINKPGQRSQPASLKLFSQALLQVNET